MALGSFGASTGGGEFSQRIEYNSKAGRMFRVDRTPSPAGGFENDKVEITQGFSALMDLENIEIGWVNFPAGQAPDTALVKLGSVVPAQPSKDHKPGFRVKMVLSSASAGGSEKVREMMSSANSARGAMDALHDAYLAGVAANPGKLPVVSMPRVIPVASKQGTNYAPEFVITSWAARPESLSLAPVAPAPARVGGPPPTGSTAPPAAPVAAVDDDDFG